MQDFSRLLQRLADAGLDFVIVGGFGGDDVERGATLRAGFGEGERAGVEEERGEGVSVGGGFLFRGRVGPVEPAGDHEMEDEPAVALETEDDALAEPAERGDAAAGERVDGRGGGAEEKRIREPDFFECAAEDAAFKSLEVDRDVRELGHD